MPAGMDSLYRLSFRDAFRAGEAMADAFANDPLWHKVFEGIPDPDRRYQACFEVPVRHCLKYGEVYATSRDLEGIAATVPDALADMTFWRMLRSGALACGMRMGTTAGRRMSDLKILSADRVQNMAGKPHVYLLLLGVRTASQGKGLGGSLLRALIEDCDERDLAIYLETETEENVRLYEHFGFELIKKIDLKNLRVPMWEMVRSPRD
jgi:ribosomal protein S18 acetylase RimI-like enzyme